MPPARARPGRHPTTRRRADRSPELLPIRPRLHAACARFAASGMPSAASAAARISPPDRARTAEACGACGAASARGRGPARRRIRLVHVLIRRIAPAKGLLGRVVLSFTLPGGYADETGVAGVDGVRPGGSPLRSRDRPDPTAFPALAVRAAAAREFLRRRGSAGRAAALWATAASSAALLLAC